MGEENKDEKLGKLIILAKKGDTDAFAAIYDILVDSVYRYIYFKVRHGEAEDLLEMTFLRVWENIHQYKKRKVSFRAWVFKIAHNLVVDHYRLRKDYDELPPSVPTNERTHNPIRMTEDVLNSETLKKAIDQLKDNYKQIIILKFINELTNSEVAKILRKSEGSLRILQFRALKELRDILKNMGIHY